MVRGPPNKQNQVGKRSKLIKSWMLTNNPQAKVWTSKKIEGFLFLSKMGKKKGGWLLERGYFLQSNPAHKLATLSSYLT